MKRTPLEVSRLSHVEVIRALPLALGVRCVSDGCQNPVLHAHRGLPSAHQLDVIHLARELGLFFWCDEHNKKGTHDPSHRGELKQLLCGPNSDCEQLMQALQVQRDAELEQGRVVTHEYGGLGWQYHVSFALARCGAEFQLDDGVRIDPVEAVRRKRVQLADLPWAKSNEWPTCQGCAERKYASISATD